jgi:hypothetical protein
VLRYAIAIGTERTNKIAGKVVRGEGKQVKGMLKTEMTLPSSLMCHALVMIWPSRHYLRDWTPLYHEMSLHILLSCFAYFSTPKLSRWRQYVSAG